MDQYKRYVRGQIKQLTEQEGDPLVGDWIVVYVWHSGIDPGSKGARKVRIAMPPLLLPSGADYGVAWILVMGL